MKPGFTPYSSLMRQSSSQTHKFIEKLGCQKHEQLHFLLVDDTKRTNGTSRSSSDSSRSSSKTKHAIKLQKSLGLMERLVPQIKLISGGNNPVHLLSHNAQGYAVFMEINHRKSEGSGIEKIRAQFIDVDLNKISVRGMTRDQVMRKVKIIQSNPLEQIQSMTIKKNRQGEYQLVAHRTEQRIAQLKQEFLKKNRTDLRDAMIIETGNGYHIYWVIQEGALSKFVPIQKALAQKFSSDPMITNLSRVMRIPGFYHMKNPSKPFLVRVVQWGRKNPFTQQELVKKFSLKP